MKIRLTQPGFETYTGQMGTVFFEDGLTTTDVKHIDAVRIAAQFLCEWEDGTTASVAQSILDHAQATTLSIPVEMNADQALALQAGTAGAEAQPEPVGSKVYTEAELEEIADKAGIKGLREIGTVIGVKGNAIGELIKAILAKQA